MSISDKLCGNITNSVYNSGDLSTFTEKADSAKSMNLLTLLSSVFMPSSEYFWFRKDAYLKTPYDTGVLRVKANRTFNVLVCYDHCCLSSEELRYFNYKVTLLRTFLTKQSCVTYVEEVCDLSFYDNHKPASAQLRRSFYDLVISPYTVNVLSVLLQMRMTGCLQYEHLYRVTLLSDMQLQLLARPTTLSSNLAHRELFDAAYRGQIMLLPSVDEKTQIYYYNTTLSFFEMLYTCFKNGCSLTGFDSIVSSGSSDVIALRTAEEQTLFRMFTLDSLKEKYYGICHNNVLDTESLFRFTFTLMSAVQYTLNTFGVSSVLLKDYIELMRSVYTDLQLHLYMKLCTDLLSAMAYVH